MPYISDVKDEPEQSKYYIGFPKGLNVIQDRNLVNDKNLIEALNAELVVDGVSRRSGTTKVWDEGGASYVWGSAPYYKREVSGITRKFVRVANGKLQYLNGSVWSDVSAQAYTNGPTDFIQARNRLFTYNGIDNLTYFDGSSITTYATLTDPSAPTVTPQGTTGSTTYSYMVNAFDGTGETASSPAGTTSTGNATLDSTNYNRITWSAVSGAIGYNIWGRKATGFGHVYLATVYGAETFDDTGETDYPQVTSRLNPIFNSSGGIIAKFGCFSVGRQWVAGITEDTEYYPTRVGYSGTLDNIDAFVGGEYGGGWVEVSSQDGGEIVDLVPYRNGVLAFKTNGIYYVFFSSTGDISVQEVTRAHGGVSFKGAQAVDNDIVYVSQKDNKLQINAIGNQANYTGTELRTNDISVFIADDLQGANRTYLSKISTFYYNDKFGFTYPAGSGTENTQGYVLDTRFGSWVKWDGGPMKVSHYTIYDDGDDVKLYGGSNIDGYMVELFKNARNDSDEAFRTVIGTKFFNGRAFDVEKIWRNPTLWFKYILGGKITAEIWIDGTKKEGTATLSSSNAGAGAGADLAGSFLAGGMTSSTAETTPNADTPEELTGLFNSRSIGFYLIDEKINSNWLFMGLHLLWTPLIGKPLNQNFRVEVV